MLGLFFVAPPHYVLRQSLSLAPELVNWVGWPASSGDLLGLPPW